ncbi:hypothetical protein [Heyndrickxia ginsengihumi]|uniref:hypothetical protein n=1 Tax=Heyndrickxia ginsengihumi TaxID=363870 RepID=UPI003D2586F7
MVSRKTLVAALSLLEGRTHAEIGKFSLIHSVENETLGSSKAERINNLTRYLISKRLEEREAEDLTFDIVKDLIEDELELIERMNGWEVTTFKDKHPKLFNYLIKDGFIIDGMSLRRKLPADLSPVINENEVDRLLNKYQMNTLKVHLDQALDNFHDSKWESSNAQLRSFMEGLFNEIADQIDPIESAKIQSDNGKRDLLGRTNPPILFSELNEITNDGKNFINGVFKRIHRKGSHPGLSDLNDCTFRIHLVYLVAAEVLRRFDQAMESRK